MATQKNIQKLWQPLLSTQSLYQTTPTLKSASSRTVFHKDYDRVIFSQSFRKLNQKTQVMLQSVVYKPDVPGC